VDLPAKCAGNKGERVEFISAKFSQEENVLHRNQLKIPVGSLPNQKVIGAVSAKYNICYPFPVLPPLSLSFAGPRAPGEVKRRRGTRGRRAGKKTTILSSLLLRTNEEGVED
jgi:hypothetical protein